MVKFRNRMKKTSIIQECGVNLGLWQNSFHKHHWLSASMQYVCYGSAISKSGLAKTKIQPATQAPDIVSIYMKEGTNYGIGLSWNTPISNGDVLIHLNFLASKFGWSQHAFENHDES